MVQRAVRFAFIRDRFVLCPWPMTSKLTKTLFPEVFQTENSAVLHPEREAKRLGGATPPARAMRAISAHATAALRRLHALAAKRGRDSAESGGLAIGRLFSILRAFGSDLVLSSEKSYRATILGARHGLGVFMLLEQAALVEGDRELADFCAEWIAERSKLVEGAERELAWFAQNPDVAMTRAHSKRALERVLEHNPEWRAPAT